MFNLFRNKLYLKCDHLSIIIIYWTNLGSTPTCVPLCTATPSQQVALKSGSLPGHSLRMPLLPLKLTNCAMPWPAQNNPGCSIGLLTDSLNTVTLYTTAYNWQLLTSTHSAHWSACTFSGTWSTLWIQTWSESRMPLPPLSTSPTTWLVSLWHGTLSGLDGHTFSLSEYKTVLF